MAMTRAGGVSVTSTYKKPKAPGIDLAGGATPPGWTQPVNPPASGPPGWNGPSGGTPIPWNPVPPGWNAQQSIASMQPGANPFIGSGWMGMPPYSGFTATPQGPASPYSTTPPAYGSTPYHRLGSQYEIPLGSRGITAGGRSVPGSGSSPQSGNDYRPSGMDMLKEQYKDYSKGLAEDGTAEDQIPSFEQWMNARYAAFNAMGGSSNINYRNIDDYYKNFNRELERIMNPRERPPEDQAGIQQSTPGGWAPVVNQRY